MAFKQKLEGIARKIRRDFFLAGIITAANCTQVITVPPICYGACIDRKLSLSSDSLNYNTITPLEIETYEESGKLVHPDVVVLPSKINNHRNVLVATPLADRGDKVENPSVYSSNNWRHWVLPTTSSKNPIALPSDTSWKVHLSDNSVAYDSQEEVVRVNYRESSRGLEERVYTMVSKDLITWSKPSVILRGKEGSFISPTFTLTPERRTWYINAEKGCYSKKTDLKSRIFVPGVENFGSEITNNISQPGYVIWHVNIDYIESKKMYAGLVAAYPVGSDCTTTDLFFVSSTDGTNWKTYQNPLLKRNQSKEFTNSVYESSLSFNPSNHTATVIYSGSNNEKGFHLAAEKMFWSTLMQRVGPENR